MSGCKIVRENTFLMFAKSKCPVPLISIKEKLLNKCGGPSHPQPVLLSERVQTTFPVLSCCKSHEWGLRGQGRKKKQSKEKCVQKQFPHFACSQYVLFPSEDEIYDVKENEL